MLTLINGDGNPRVTAAQDADWYGSLTGEKTCIMPANDKFSATVADANTIEISSGVLITKEGRRVQIDAETIEEIIIPTGTQGTDTYYIIGFHLHIDESGQQVAETFVETMENESDTITETTFREGSTSIYISLYRVKRSGLTLESVTRICPMYEISADEIVYGNTNVGSELTQINQGLSSINSDLADSLTWKFYSDRINGRASDLPADWNELQVVIFNTQQPYLYYTFNYNKTSWVQNTSHANSGYYRTATDYQVCTLELTPTSIRLERLVGSGTEYATEGQTHQHIYYR